MGALFLMSEVSLFTESYTWGGAGLEQTPQMTNQAMEEELMMARSKITVHPPTGVPRSQEMALP